MKSHRSRYSGYRFPPEIISYAVWAYHLWLSEIVYTTRIVADHMFSEIRSDRRNSSKLAGDECRHGDVALWIRLNT
jgi:hypothetical protein